jgi:LysM repeat protein
MRLKSSMVALILVVFLAPALVEFHTTPAHAQQGAQTHVVQPGENLFRIALQYGITWPVLAAANNISNPNLIYVGQVLIIPGSGGTQPPPAQPTQPPSTPQTYVVVAGDTLSGIAARFGTTVDALVQANGRRSRLKCRSRRSPVRSRLNPRSRLKRPPRLCRRLHRSHPAALNWADMSKVSLM